MERNKRQRILDGALDLLRDEEAGPVTLDAVARQVGLTKPGLMYHFPTKAALLLGIVQHVADRWEHLLLARLGQPVGTATAHQRIRAYVEVLLTAPLDRADLAVYTDAAYADALNRTWDRHFASWVHLPDDLPAPVRGRLTAVRLLADGYWISVATGVLPVAEHDRAPLLAVAEELLEGGTPS